MRLSQALVHFVTARASLFPDQSANISGRLTADFKTFHLPFPILFVCTHGHQDAVWRLSKVRFTLALSPSQVHVITKRCRLSQIDVFHPFFHLHRDFAGHFDVIQEHGQEQTLLTMHKQTFSIWYFVPIQVPAELPQLVFLKKAGQWVTISGSSVMDHDLGQCAVANVSRCLDTLTWDVLAMLERPP